MLNLIHLHILREIALSAFLAMMLFVFVLLMGNALKDIVELVVAGQLRWVLFFKLIALLIPYVFAYALPLGMLTGTLLALGRLSSNNEITAMKASGLGLYQIVAPIFLVATIGVVAAVVVNLHYAPKARNAYKELMASAVTENPVSFIEAKRFINEFPGAVIYTGSRDGTNLEDIWFWKLDDKKRVELFIRGNKGRVEFREADNTLVLTLIDGTTEKRNPLSPEQFSSMSFDMLDFGELPFEWSLDEIFSRQSASGTKIKYMTFSQLLKLRESLLVAERGEGLSIDRLQAQFYLQKNFALSFSVFSLAIFGVPLALRTGRKE
ncbi:MAG: LptF/LptG family permease, partial [Verrucomicrobiota bacterium]|nr:LptF/LptG family permease [Verrucomicrobiota bacterium]